MYLTGITWYYAIPINSLLSIFSYKFCMNANELQSKTTYIDIHTQIYWTMKIEVQIYTHVCTRIWVCVYISTSRRCEVMRYVTYKGYKDWNWGPPNWTSCCVKHSRSCQVFHLVLFASGPSCLLCFVFVAVKFKLVLTAQYFRSTIA